MSLDGIMRKIEGLLAVAEDPATTPESAATYRARAEEMLLRYRIEEEDLIRNSLASDVAPVYRSIDIVPFNSEFIHQYHWLFTALTRHCGVRWASERSGGSYRAGVVGYDVDVRLLEMLWNSARLVFGASLEPRPDPKLSDAENVYRMRSAGIERNRIAEMLWGADLGKAGHSAHARVGRLYREACEARGEDPAVAGRKISARTYREVYAREFVSEVESRLRRARDAAGAMVGAMVSVSRIERVNEAFYTRYPSHRPAPKAEGPAIPKPAKHRPPTKADRERWQREYYSEAARMATAAGQKAAQEIILDRARQHQMGPSPEQPSRRMAELDG